ncbi:putative exocyst complex component sec8 [Acrodontium crateriforme]|uniref:Exocyst complex component Sec8 n=1 Tax=Acrodontium crateriforme TaxID=150365 RepID=A0AAQ3M3T8_9PEZI|nr:putative exocyst complex component sec8 [Acrodontium crateriforme]
MSYMRAQPNGSSNRANGSDPNRLGRFDFDDTPETSADERSRSRGAGGYGYGAQPGEHVHGPPRVERQHANRRSKGPDDWNESRSRSGHGQRYGSAGSQVDEILKYIERNWNFMASDDCIPIKVALQLMDSSSLGLADQQDQFQEVHQQLQSALKIIVNEHHQGFNSSIGTFHKIQAAIHASQHRVRALRASMVQARGTLTTTRPELKALAANSQSYDQMLQIVSTIEHLQLVPERLEAEISEKRFLAAVDTLQEALALIRKSEMEDIGALGDLKVYLSNQEHSLTDILIEDLHSHLYLKSPYCEERWKSHTNFDNTIDSMVARDTRAVHGFLETYDGSKPMQEDTTRNPEVGTFYYIQLLVESLNKMAKLEVAVDAIEQRLPVELFRVVERSHGEVEQRHPQSIMRSTARRQQGAFEPSDGPDDERKAILEDLLMTLYAKFEAIAEGHRVLHEVTAAILKRDDQTEATALNRSFRELWKLLQSEIRSLLHDHLATNGNIAGQKSRAGNDSSANIFQQRSRDKTRKLFKLADTDSNATDLTTERDDLEFILKASVPGLVNTQKVQQAKKDRDADALNADRSATGHKLLVEPSVFNMGILLPPSLAFLNRLKDVVPAQSGVVAGTLTSFLDDFLINVFYPQLEETLLELCSRAMNELEAFQADPTATQKYSPRAIFKGTARFFELIETFCEMLDSLPHEQSFSQLVITQMRTYYDKCYQWCKTLLQRTVAGQDGAAIKMKLAADLVITGEVSDTVVELMNTFMKSQSADQQTSAGSLEKEANVLAEKESALLINMIKARRLEEADLISDRKFISALCTLHVSMKWLAARCQSLRYVSPRAVDLSNMQSNTTRRWTNNAHLPSAPSHVYLPLDAQTATQFDAVVTSFSELGNLVLRILHVDLRLHLLHGIYASMDTTYVLSQPYNDPNAAILTLTARLGTYGATTSAHLLPPQLAFLAAQLDVLANNALCTLVATIPAMDHHGIVRLQLNVLVLQQALKNIQPSATLERAARFYELSEMGPKEIVDKGIKEGYDTPDLKTLIRLCWNDERDAKLGTVDEVVGQL